VLHKNSPRDSPFDLPPDPPLELEFPEHRYFMGTPSMITPSLYISSYNPSLDKHLLKNTLHITHIINCTGSPNAFPDHFEYLHLKLHDDPSQDIWQPLPRVLDFIRDALLHRGKILVFSDKGVSRSAALVIAHLMDTYSQTYIEAFLYVRDRRYIISPNSGFVQQLCKWGAIRRTQKGIDNGTFEARYHCICGACTFTLATPFENTKVQNPRPCNCSADDTTDCPNYFGCAHTIEEIKKIHNFNLDAIWWGTTALKNVTGDYDRTVEAQILKTNKQPLNTRKDWKLYRCKTCHYITHAISLSRTPEKHGPTISLVTNIMQRPYLHPK